MSDTPRQSIVKVGIAAVGLTTGLLAGVILTTNLDNVRDTQVIRYAECQYLAASSNMSIDQLALGEVACTTVQSYIHDNSSVVKYYDDIRTKMLKLAPYDVPAADTTVHKPHTAGVGYPDSITVIIP